MAWRKTGGPASRAEQGDAAAAQDGYHPVLCKAYADELDGHTDLAPALVIEQLMAYPDARFVYTTRPVPEWSRAMIAFTQEEPRKSLFQTHPTPFHFYNATYGKGWGSFREEDWARCYARHDQRVRRLFRHDRGRLLEISITAMGKAGQSDEIWRRLCGFLEVPLPSATHVSRTTTTGRRRCRFPACVSVFRHRSAPAAGRLWSRAAGCRPGQGSCCSWRARSAASGFGTWGRARARAE